MKLFQYLPVSHVIYHACINHIANESVGALGSTTLFGTLGVLSLWCARSISMGSHLTRAPFDASSSSWLLLPAHRVVSDGWCTVLISAPEKDATRGSVARPGTHHGGFYRDCERGLTVPDYPCNTCGESREMPPGADDLAHSRYRIITVAGVRQPAIPCSRYYWISINHGRRPAARIPTAPRISIWPRETSYRPPQTYAVTT